MMPNTELGRKLTFKEFAEILDNMPLEDRARLFKFNQKWLELQDIKLQLATMGLDKSAINEWAFDFIGKPELLKAFIRLFAIFGLDGMDAMVHELVYGVN